MRGWVPVREPDEIERAVATIADRSGGGLIVTASGLAILHRELIITLAARHRLPAVYPYRFFVIDGGLISYGPSSINPYRRAAGYIDRILKGEKPGDHQVRVGDQPQGRQGPWPRRAAYATRPRRRGDRMMGWMAPLRHRHAKLVF
jgi:ABC-type uncharacterized transport system substrate-binding protein